MGKTYTGRKFNNKQYYLVGIFQTSVNYNNQKELDQRIQERDQKILAAKEKLPGHKFRRVKLQAGTISLYARKISR